MHRVLTIRQPWAWAVVWGHKGTENRSGGARRWAHAQGAVVWVHAASTWSPRGAADARVVAAWVGAGSPDPYRAQLDPPQRLAGTRVKVHPSELHDGTVAQRLHLGAIIGKVVVTDVHDAQPGCCADPWAEQLYRNANDQVVATVVHLTLAAPSYLPDPVPCSGRLGLWQPDPELVAELADADAELVAAD